MSETERERMFDEAAKIFVRLNTAPDDPAAARARDAFLARGEDAQEVYRKVSKVWAASGRRRSSGAVLSLFLAACLFLAGYVWFDDVRVQVLADLSTGRQPAKSVLGSGDRVELDAGSALVDRSSAGQRDIEILKGAAVFDVIEDGNAFTVSVGELQATVLGTRFETALFQDGASVTVLEGLVEVEYGGETWNLAPGQSLRHREGGGVSIGPVNTAQIANWRNGRLIADGVPLAEVVEIIDRRLLGRIILMDASLAESKVTGGFNLDNPRSALEAVASGLGATVVFTPPLGALILAPE
ncbi:MAG: FecR domain-containing protein [Pseudomonadota bacterium]